MARGGSGGSKPKVGSGPGFARGGAPGGGSPGNKAIPTRGNATGPQIGGKGSNRNRAVPTPRRVS